MAIPTNTKKTVADPVTGNEIWQITDTYFYDGDGNGDGGGGGGGGPTPPPPPSPTFPPLQSTIQLSDSVLGIGETATVTITFTTPVTGFDNSDLTVEGGTLSTVQTSDGATWTATFTPTEGITDTSNVITLNNAGVTKLSDELPGTDTTTSVNYSIDTVAPTTANIVVANTGMSAGETSPVTITFSEAVTSLETSDFVVEHGTLTDLATADGITWTATLTPNAGMTSNFNAITLAGAQYADLAGNAGTGTARSNQYLVDTVAPTATLSSAAVANGGIVGTAGRTIPVTVTFSESVMGLNVGDLEVTNGTISGLSGSGRNYTFDVTPTASGPVEIRVVANAANDSAGNGNDASPTFAFTADAVAPTASITVADTTLTRGETSTVTITFSEAVVGFTLDDLTVEGGTLNYLSSGGDGGITWTATFTPTDNITDTSNVITLANSGVKDMAGNTGTGTTVSNTYAVETDINDAPVNVVPVGVTIKEDQAVFVPVTGFSVSDVDSGTLTVTLSIADGRGLLSLGNDGGVTFTQGGARGVAAMTFSGSTSAVNNALASLALTPAENYNGVATITMTSTDLAGASDTDTAQITITPVNDAPVAQASTATLAEDTTHTFTAGEFRFSDVEGNALAAVKIGGLPSGGTLYTVANGVRTAVVAGDEVTRAQIDAGQFIFVPTQDANGTASFTFQVRDDGGTTNGGTDLSGSQTFTLTTTAVNDAPVATITSAPGRVGGELLVNTATVGEQANQQITSLSNGGFVVTWHDLSRGVGGATGDTSEHAVKAQVYGADGMRVGSELLVNTATASFQFNPQVRSLSNGGFVVTWEDFSQGVGGATGDGSGYAVKAQVYAADGARVGSELLVNTATAGYQFAQQITSLSNGGFVVTWQDNSFGDGGATGDASNSAIKAQVYAADGARVGGEVLVNTATASAQISPQITSLSNGGFVVTWRDFSQGVGGATGDASNSAIKAQVYAADGARVGSELLVNTATFSDQTTPQMTSLSNGGFVVTWQDNSSGDGGATGDGSSSAIKAQVYAADGARVGGEVLVNTATANIQFNPQITSLSNGGFVVTWRDFSQGIGGATGDGSGYAVKAQVYAADGVRVGSELLVNTATANNQNSQQITSLSNGGFVVTWMDYSQGVGGATGDTTGYAIKAQVYAANGVRVGSELLVNTATAGDQTTPQITSLPNGGFVVTWMDYSQGVGGATGDASGYAVKAQVFGAGGGFAATEGQILDLKGAMAVADVDAGSGTMTATVSATYGQLTLTAGNSGATIVSGNGTGSVVVSGTLAQINALFGSASTATIGYATSDDTPPASATLTLSVNDNGNTGTGGALIGTTTAQIAITAVNDAPVNIAPATLTLLEDGTGAIAGVSVGDADSASLSVTVSVTNGTLTLGTLTGLTFTAGDGTADQTMTFSGSQADLNAALATLGYAQTADYNGAATLTITTRDAAGAVDTDTVAITITPVADAVNDAVTVAEDSGASVINVLVNDSFENAGAVVTAVSQGSIGSVTLVNGVVRYTPNANANGTDSFTYTVTSGGVTETATVNVTVTAVNDAPVVDLNGAAGGANASATFVEGNALIFLVPDVIITDIDGNLAGGRLEVDVRDLRMGEDNLFAVEGRGLTLAQTDMIVTYSYNGTEIARVDLAGAATGTLTFDLLAGATVEAVQILGQAFVFSNASDNPTAGVRNFAVTLYDAAGVASNVATSSVTVVATNDAPVLDLNGSGEDTSAVLAYRENDGAKAIAPAATVVDPDSADFAGGTLTVSITDGGTAAQDVLSVLSSSTLVASGGSINTFTQTVMIVPGPNGLPIVIPGWITGPRIATYSGGTNGAPLVVTFTASATPALVQQVTQAIAYTNTSENPSGATRSLTFVLTDGDNGSTTTAATVAVTPVDDAPVAVADTGSVLETGTTTGNVLSNDTDVDGGPLLVAAVNGSTTTVGQEVTLLSGAKLTLNANGSYSYNPNGAFERLAAAGSGAPLDQTQATDSFTYTLNDGSTATVTITINGEDNRDVVIIANTDPMATETISTGLADDQVTATGSASFVVDAGAGNDTVMTDTGNDRVSGGTGNDTIETGAGDDSVDGGDGDDTIVGGAGEGDDFYNGGAGTDTVTYTSQTTGLTIDLRATNRQADMTLSDDVRTRLGDVLEANTGSRTTPSGYAFGGAIGVDALVAIENVTGGAGDDTINGTDNANIINGGAGNDRLFGNGGADTIDGGAGDDIVSGGAGNDVLIGGEGTDTLFYGDITNSVQVNLVDGQVNVGLQGGVDQVSGFENAVLGSGNDQFIGDAGDNRIEGGAGNDQIDGGDGLDTAVYRGVAATDGTAQQFGNELSFTPGGGLGTDRLTSVERVVFVNGGETFTVSVQDGNALVASRNDVDAVTATSTTTTGATPATLTTTAATGVLSNDVNLDQGAGDQKVVAAVSFGETGGTVGQALVGTYGTLTLNADGSYTYVANTAATVALVAGATGQDVFTYRADDGDVGDSAPATLTFTVTGANETATITGTATGGVTEDAAATLTTDGQLTASDVDTGEAGFLVQAGTTGTNGYGIFTLDATGRWVYTADNSQTAIQQLGAGDTITDSFTAVSTDGTASQVVTVTITGTNDAVTLTGGQIGAILDTAATDTFATITGRIDNDPSAIATGTGQLADVDRGDVYSYTLVGTPDETYGTFVLNADGTYSFTPNSTVINALPAGVSATVTYRVEVSDNAGSTSQADFTIAITGSNDTATITGQLSGSVTEDVAVNDGILTATGTVTVSDVDTGQATIIPQTGTSGEYGTFSITAAGNWTFTVDNESVQFLGVGETITQGFEVRSADGTGVEFVEVTINGTNDRPEVTGGVLVTYQDTSATDDFATFSGRIGDFFPLERALVEGQGDFSVGSVTDLDENDVIFTYARAGSAEENAINDAYGVLTVNPDGSYTFTPDDAAINALTGPLTLSYTISADDGSGTDNAVGTGVFTIQLNGVQDAPVTGGDTTASVTEDAVAAGTTNLVATGALTSADVDTGENGVFRAITIVGTYGTLVLAADGTYTYTADNTQRSIQEIGQGSTRTDSFTVQTADGTTVPVVVTINGTNDAPVVTAGVYSQTVAETDVAIALTGQILVQDDVGDTQGYARTGSVVTASGRTLTTAQTAAIADAFAIDATTGAYSFNLASPDYLDPGQSVTATFTVTVTDQFGASTTQDVTFTVTGTLEAGPVATVDDDVLTGGQFGDAITGLAGDDIIRGLSGNDVIDAGAGDDQVDGGSGDDTIRGSAGDDQLVGGSGNDQLFGGTENDTLSGGSGEDLLSAGTGINIVDGGADVDLGVLELTSDKYLVTTTSATTVVFASADGTERTTFTNVESYRFVDGTLMVVDAAGRTLTGTSGDNVLGAGGSGTSVIDGGAGTDTGVLVGNYADYAISQATDGTVTFQRSGETSRFANVERYRFADGTELTVGANGARVFTLPSGSNTALATGAGNDAIFAGNGTLTGADRIDGGAGNDQLGLQGDYTGANRLVLEAGTLSNIEVLAVLTGGSYDIVSNDATVAAGQVFTVTSNGLAAGESLTFDGSAETDGSFLMFGGLGTDVLTGGANSDAFFFGPDRFGSGDVVTGGGGVDQLGLDGLTSGLILGANADVEVVALLRGPTGTPNNYGNIVVDDSWVAAGQTKIITAVTSFGSSSGPVETDLVIDGSAETNGNLRILAGSGNDTIFGGAGNDLLFGGLGRDYLVGGAGADTFVFNAAAESTSTGFDTILDFDRSVDSIQVNGQSFTSFADRSGGDLSQDNFDTDLSVALGTSLTGTNGVFFTATGGLYAGQTFLVLNTDGVDGYQAGQDVVIRTSLGNLPPAMIAPPVGDIGAGQLDTLHAHQAIIG